MAILLDVDDSNAIDALINILITLSLYISVLTVDPRQGLSTFIYVAPFVKEVIIWKDKSSQLTQ